MQNYHNQFVRYERHGDRVQPVRVRKEMLNNKLTVVRVTEVNFPGTESVWLSSEQLDGWGSCSVAGKWQYPSTREQLVHMNCLKPAGYNMPTLWLDEKAYASHELDICNMARGFAPVLPNSILPDGTPIETLSEF